MKRSYAIARTIAIFAVLFPALALAQGTGPHVSIGTLAGDAAGLDDGYVHFGGFVPLAEPDRHSLLFAEGSLLLFNEGSDQLGGNVGVGYRAYCEETGTILGGHFHYDRRDLGLAEFDQLGVGLESLGELFDARLNVNVPINETRRDAIALSTIDGEVAALLTENDWAQVRAMIGVYGLFHDTIEETAGVRGRVELRLADQCFVGGYVEQDDLFDTTGGLTFEYRFGRGDSPRENSARTLLARLGDPVSRRRHVVVASNAMLAASVTGVVETEEEPTTGGPPITPGGTTDTPEPESPGPDLTPDTEPPGGRPSYVPPVRPAIDDPIDPGVTPGGGERGPYRPPVRDEFAPLTIPEATGGRPDYRPPVRGELPNGA